MTPTTLDFQLGDPVEHRGIVVTPLFPTRDPVAGVRHARRGAAARPHDHRDVRRRHRARARRDNPLDERGAALRRRGARRREAEPHPQRHRARRRRRDAADPRLLRRAGPLGALVGRLRRRRRTSRTRSCAAARPRCTRRRPLARGVAQSEVWDGDAREAAADVRRLADRREPRHVRRATATALRKLEDAFPLQPGQCGAVLAIGDDLCLDTVSRPDAFALLWPKLRAGYLLDALERLDQRPTDVERIAGFVDEVADAVVTRGALRRARRGRAPARPRRDRLRPRARRRADPAHRLHERRRRASGLRADRPTQPAALSSPAQPANPAGIVVSWSSGTPSRRMSSSRPG